MMSGNTGRSATSVKPVDLAQRYFEEGADEITFLNITGFRDFPLTDQPMLEVLKKTSENVFVPLTIGGGIRANSPIRKEDFTAHSMSPPNIFAPEPIKSPSAAMRSRQLKITCKTSRADRKRVQLNRYLLSTAPRPSSSRLTQGAVYVEFP